MKAYFVQLIRLTNYSHALGAEGRRFGSSRPDHLKQGFMAIYRGPFLSKSAKQFEEDAKKLTGKLVKEICHQRRHTR